ncbi:MAG: GntR family transcriptional regulator, partial [Pigmentiphaga sp.]|nr:GntR family transcriptional regulator [Pigmentiphaga sp.]
MINTHSLGQAPSSIPKTLVESAYAALRRDIIEGKLMPGLKLRVEHLKDDYGVGAGTLREALALLVSDALVLTQGQRGFRVAPISAEDFEDITRNRMLLECEALR